jgi:hypothetical protein
MTADAGRSCAACAFFENAPLALEEQIPGLRTLSSGFAAVRDRDGLCRRHDRYLPASASCPEFAPAVRIAGIVPACRTKEKAASSRRCRRP